MTKIFTILLVVLSLSKLSAQCAATNPTTSTSIYSMTTVYSSSMGVHIAICCNGILYDTLNNSNNMFYYLEPGGKLYKKGGVTTMVWMKAGTTLTNRGGTSSIMAYSEPTATITNIGLPPVNNNTCAVVSTPQSNCYPLGGGCGSNGLNKWKVNYNSILIQNPSNQNLIVTNSNTSVLKGELVNALGQVVLTMELTVGHSNFDISGLKSGMYFLNISDKNDRIETKKLIIN